MRRATIVLLVLGLSACASPPIADRDRRVEATDAESAWLPLKPGTRWVYQARRHNYTRFTGVPAPQGDPDSTEDEVRVEGLERVGAGSALAWRVYRADGKGYDLLRARGGVSWLVERAGDSLIESGRLPDGQERHASAVARHPNALVRIPEDPRPGRRWTYSFPHGGQLRQLNAEVLGFEDVVTPAGRFEGCLKIRMGGSWFDHARTRGRQLPIRLEVVEWWAPGVGKVRHVQKLTGTRRLSGHRGGMAEFGIESTLTLQDWFSSPPIRRTPPPRRADPYGRLGRELRARLEAGQLGRLESTLAEFEAQQVSGARTTGEVSALYTDLAQAELRALDAWVGRRPDSHAALAARGIHLKDLASRLRGSRSRGATSQEQTFGMRAASLRAVEDLTRALELRKDHVPSLRALRSIALLKGSSGLQRSLFERLRAVETDPFDAYQAYSLGLLPRWGGSEEAMLALVEEARRLHGPELGDRVASDTYERLAYWVYEKDTRRAEELYDAAVGLDEAARDARAGFYIKNGRYREALDDVDRRLASTGADASRLIRRSGIYRRLGYPDLALADVEAAVAADPENPIVHVELAGVALRAGRLDESLAAWDRVVERAPQSGSYWMQRADLLLGFMDQPGRAAESYGKALALRPGDPWRQYRYARALHRAGDPAARAALENFLRTSQGMKSFSSSRRAAERMLAGYPAKPGTAP